MPRKSLAERSAERPPWMKIRLQDQDTVDGVSSMMRELRLTTVCEEAKCPNLFECWADRTATFMLMGEVCTRHCGFCAVGKGETQLLDPEEPEHVAEAVERLKLEHAVVTSVNRDDLPDGGARHFAATIDAIRRRRPTCQVEVLIPDFGGVAESIDMVLAAAPEVLNHNVETVPRLYKRVRSGSSFQRSLDVLQRASRAKPGLISRTKSGVMVGLGEQIDELVEVFKALREVNVDVLTVGQYLQPSNKHLPIERWYTPEEFAHLREEALKLGFLHVESGPFVRSSYHAKQHVAGLSGKK